MPPAAAAMSAATVSAAAMAWPVVPGAMDRPLMAGTIDRAMVSGAMHRAMMDAMMPVDDARVTPAVPTGGAAPADPPPPGVAAPVPARSSPGGIVPAVVPASPNELRLLHGRILDKRSGRGERANADLRRSGKRELENHSG
jgi:hypothetical protein